MQARLLLEDGTLFTGKSFGAETEHAGEVIFHTGVTGYQELISSPASAGQIVVMTYPLVGNYGITRSEFESLTPFIHGLVVRSHEPYPSNWRAQHSLSQLLQKHGIPAISDIDTRMLTRKLRQNGSMRGIITTGNESVEALLEKLNGSKPVTDAVERASTSSIYFCPGKGERVVLVDFGAKNSILAQLIKRGCDVVVVPHNTTAAQIRELSPDGIVLSDGPGNPQDLPYAIEMVKELLGELPIFGISLGHQLFALACGARTEKMKFGHHGGNYPVKKLSTNECFITSQGHGYAVHKDSVQSTELVITYINNNDGTVEGLQHQTAPAFSVQFHPESAPGSHDLLSLFDEFLTMMIEHKNSNKVPPQVALMEKLKGELQHA
ncbi:glutamine-hydrolyzing carbamoyl-phosphate synthase small subunit [Paenibacillus sp. IITD108]|uniref:glutamine-hydrolyzing carbamoyl-phosphate synthase small subunit n=1 Tax=Paenibacillus sp. IITD108 TaxID=3116649 RepID=UPI002F41B9A8